MVRQAPASPPATCRSTSVISRPVGGVATTTAASKGWCLIRKSLRRRRPASSSGVSRSSSVPASPPSASFAPVWIARDAGLYAKYGLRADVVNLGPNGAAPLIGGDVDVVQVAGPSVFAANLEGGDTLWILVPLNRAVLYLMARPEI